jgi:hypothetical protein
MLVAGISVASNASLAATSDTGMLMVRLPLSAQFSNIKSSSWLVHMSRLPSLSVTQIVPLMNAEVGLMSSAMRQSEHKTAPGTGTSLLQTCA